MVSRLKEKDINVYNIDEYLKQKKKAGNKRTFLSKYNWDLLYQLVCLNGFSDQIKDNCIEYLSLKIYANKTNKNNN